MAAANNKHSKISKKYGNDGENGDKWRVLTHFVTKWQ